MGGGVRREGEAGGVQTSSGVWILPAPLTGLRVALGAYPPQLPFLTGCLPGSLPARLPARLPPSLPGTCFIVPPPSPSLQPPTVGPPSLLPHSPMTMKASKECQEEWVKYLWPNTASLARTSRVKVERMPMLVQASISSARCTVGRGRGWKGKGLVCGWMRRAEAAAAGRCGQG